QLRAQIYRFRQISLLQMSVERLKDLSASTVMKHLIGVDSVREQPPDCPSVHINIAVKAVQVVNEATQTKEFRAGLLPFCGQDRCLDGPSNAAPAPEESTRLLLPCTESLDDYPVVRTRWVSPFKTDFLDLRFQPTFEHRKD